MPSLLVVVFVIQLTIYLINTIGAETINELLWQAYCASPLSSVNTKDQSQLRRDVVRLKREMNAISAQDDFARWAKLRRQHDKAMAEYDQKTTVIRWISTNGLRYALQFWYAKTPVYTYPRGWLPWYAEWTLGLPRCPRGGVSISIWSAACVTAISLVGDLLLFVFQSVQAGQQQQQQQQKKGEPMKVGVGVGGQREKKSQ